MDFVDLPQADFYMADDVFIRHINILKTGTIVPQHMHNYDHTSFIARGSVLAWKGEEFLGTLKAPFGLLIPAGTQHCFQSLEDNTSILCIHNMHGIPPHLLEDHMISKETA